MYPECIQWNVMREDLRDDGWTELDDEQTEIDGWTHYGVSNTGGHIYCRIWQQEEYGDLEPGEVCYEVLYGDRFDGASLNRYVGDEEMGRVFDGNVANVEADENTDEACLAAARELIENLDEYVDDEVEA